MLQCGPALIAPISVQLEELRGCSAELSNCAAHSTKICSIVSFKRTQQTNRSWQVIPQYGRACRSRYVQIPVVQGSGDIWLCSFRTIRIGQRRRFRSSLFTFAKLCFHCELTKLQLITV